MTASAILVRIRALGCGVYIPEALVVRKEGSGQYTLPETPTFWDESPIEAVKRALEHQAGATFEIWVNNFPQT